jgi:hypothetical protein
MDEFVMMTDLGFFFRSGEIYKMTIPSDLSLSKVKAATLRYVQTEDDDYELHPEHLVYLQPLSEARQWQARWLAISSFRQGKTIPFGAKPHS